MIVGDTRALALDVTVDSGTLDEVEVGAGPTVAEEPAGV